VIADLLLKLSPQSPQKLTRESPKAKVADRLGAATVDAEAAVAVEAEVAANSRARTHPRVSRVSRTNPVSRISPRVNSRRRAGFLALSKRSLAAMDPTLTMRLSKSGRVASEKGVRSAAT